MKKRINQPAVPLTQKRLRFPLPPLGVAVPSFAPPAAGMREFPELGRLEIPHTRTHTHTLESVFLFAAEGRPLCFLPFKILFFPLLVARLFFSFCFRLAVDSETIESHLNRRADGRTGGQKQRP